MQFFDKENNTTSVASWPDLIDVFKKESEGIVTGITMSYAVLYPTNIDKQKVSRQNKFRLWYDSKELTKLLGLLN